MSNSTILRRTGVLVLGLAGVTFMLEGWASLTSFGKYGAFLGFTVVLAALGVFCSRRLKENKGARTFLALAIAAVPALFSQIGAMVLAWAGSGDVAQVPSFFRYETSDPEMILWAAGLAFAILPVVGYFGFSVLYREQSTRLSKVFLLLNLVLLVPTRDSFLGLIAIATMAIALVDLELRHFGPDPSAKTGEARVARFLLATPAIAVFGRSLFYPMSSAVQGGYGLLAALALFDLAPRLLEHREDEANLCQSASSVAAGIGWYLLTCSLSSSPLVTLFPISWILILQARFALSHPSRFRNAAGVFAVLSSISVLLSAPTVLGSVVLIVSGALMHLMGRQEGDEALATGGAISLLSGVGRHFHLALDLYRMSPWGALAGVGITLIIVSSLVERHRPSMRVARSPIQPWPKVKPPVKVEAVHHPLK